MANALEQKKNNCTKSVTGVFFFMLRWILEMSRDFYNHVGHSNGIICYKKKKKNTDMQGILPARGAMR